MKPPIPHTLTITETTENGTTSRQYTATCPGVTDHCRALRLCEAPGCDLDDEDHDEVEAHDQLHIVTAAWLTGGQDEFAPYLAQQLRDPEVRAAYNAEANGTDKPYTDADVELAADALARVWDYRDPHAQSDARAVLDALAAAGRLAPADDDPRHIIELRPDGWTIKHPLSCRLGDLFGCAVNQAAENLNGPPAPPGRYAVTVDSIDGRLRIGDRIDQPSPTISHRRHP